MDAEKRIKACQVFSAVLHSSSLPSVYQVNMVFKLTVALVSLAAFVSAANFKRVTCPDGVNTATNEAVSIFLTSLRFNA